MKVDAFARLAAVAWIPFFAAGAMLVVPLTGEPHGYRVVTFGIGAAMIVYASCVAECRGYVAPRFAVAIGDASYSIYLGHVLALFCVRWVYDRIGVANAVSGAITMLAALIVTVILGMLSFRFFERPVTRFLQRGVPGHRDPAKISRGLL